LATGDGGEIETDFGPILVRTNGYQLPASGAQKLVAKKVLAFRESIMVIINPR
jgi:hypothetical protein